MFKKQNEVIIIAWDSNDCIRKIASNGSRDYLFHLCYFSFQTYNYNLMMDERASARHLGDSYPAVRYQPFGDLVAQVYLLVAQAEERAERREEDEARAKEANRVDYRGERMRRLAGEHTAPQYDRLQFVGR